jgi:hypothetical protein
LLLIGSARSAEPLRGRVEALQFTSDHQIICSGSKDVLSTGPPFPLVSWTSQPAVNVPITHTGGSDCRIRIFIEVRFPDPGENAPFRLQGTSREPALCFVHEGKTLPGGRLNLAVEASAALGGQVRIIRQPIRWTMTLHPGTAQARTIDLGSTGPHVVYVTLGRPRVSADPLSIVTESRLALAVERVAAAQGVAGVSAAPPWLLWHLMQQNGRAYVPTRDYRKHPWRLPETWSMSPPGASCVSIVEFVRLISDMIGLPGALATTAFHARHDEPRRAVPGSLGDPPFTKTGPGGETWYLLLADNNNSQHGQIAGQGGMNYYEAALEYTWNGNTYWYPGGTDRVYDSPDLVLSIFRTLVWAGYDWHREEWIVREVVHTYSRPGDRQPDSVPLPR